MDSSEQVPRHVSVPSLIGWLSLCMLAAGWGRTIDANRQGLWIKAGAAGLIAAVVLERAERVRLSRRARKRSEAARMVSENRLAALHEYHLTRSSVADAVRQLTLYAGNDVHQFPLKILAICHDAPFDIDSAPSIEGTLVAISANRVSFAHQQPVEDPVVLLKFKPHKRKTLCFVTEIIGTKPASDGFTSSGALLAAGVPRPTADAEPAHSAAH
jgi:hypothetical protein